MKVFRKIIEIDEELCDGCGNCVPSCAEGALEIVDGKARVIAEIYCDGLGACLGDCPQNALQIVEREADDFDEQAVEELLASQKAAAAAVQETAACACGSASFETLTPLTPCQQANQPLANPLAGQGDSALSHWPVQIRLVPPAAPFLKNSDLLVAADCTPLAYPHFHRDLLQNRVVMMGCPKFDDAEAYIQKFTEIFSTAELRSVTIAIMEVPCCSSMRGIIGEAMKRSGKQVDVEEVVIGTRGEIVSRRKEAA